jgi:hypothetical protein
VTDVGRIERAAENAYARHYERICPEPSTTYL